DLADLLRRREERVPHEAETRQSALTGLLVSRPARVRHQDRDVPEVRSVADCRLDPNLGGHTDNDEHADSAVAQRDVQRSPLQGRHRDLVEYGLRWKGRHPGREVSAGGVTEE